MSRQLPLFENPIPPWVAAIWRTIPPEKRREIVALLAEMGSAALCARTTAEKEREEKGDES